MSYEGLLCVLVKSADLKPSPGPTTPGMGPGSVPAGPGVALPKPQQELGGLGFAPKPPVPTTPPAQPSMAPSMPAAAPGVDPAALRQEAQKSIVGPFQRITSTKGTWDKMSLGQDMSKNTGIPFGTLYDISGNPSLVEKLPQDQQIKLVRSMHDYAKANGATPEEIAASEATLNKITSSQSAAPAQAVPEAPAAPGANPVAATPSSGGLGGIMDWIKNNPGTSLGIAGGGAGLIYLLSKLFSGGQQEQQPVQQAPIPMQFLPQQRSMYNRQDIA